MPVRSFVKVFDIFTPETRVNQPHDLAESEKLKQNELFSAGLIVVKIIDSCEGVLVILAGVLIVTMK